MGEYAYTIAFGHRHAVQVLAQTSAWHTSDALFGSWCSLTERHLRQESGRVPHLELDDHGGQDRPSETKESHPWEPAECQHQASKGGASKDAELIAHGEQPGGGGP